MVHKGSIDPRTPIYLRYKYVSVGHVRENWIVRGSHRLSAYFYVRRTNRSASLSRHIKLLHLVNRRLENACRVMTSKAKNFLIKFSSTKTILLWSNCKKNRSAPESIAKEVNLFLLASPNSFILVGNKGEINVWEETLSRLLRIM